MIIIVSSITVFADVLFVHQLGANHGPRASFTQVNHSVRALLFFSISFRAMFLSNGTVISISLQVEFTESFTMMSGLFVAIVLSVLTGMSHMVVMLLSLLCITVSGSCWYHLSVILISWSLQMLQWRHAAALLCLATHSILANTSHPDTI